MEGKGVRERGREGGRERRASEEGTITAKWK